MKSPATFNMKEQVISRAHRIGAIRPIYVETLAMRGPVEEQMLKFLQTVHEEFENQIMKVHGHTMHYLSFLIAIIWLTLVLCSPVLVPVVLDGLLEGIFLAYLIFWSSFTGIERIDLAFVIKKLPNYFVGINMLQDSNLAMDLKEIMAVGEIVLAASIKVLVEKLASGELWKFARREGIHIALEKWRGMLEEITAVLADAEEKQTKESIQKWLEDLEDLAYDLDDVIDEIATEALRRKLKHQERLASIHKVRAFIPACLRPSTVLSDFRMKSKLDKITPRLQNLFERRSGFGLQRVAAVASASVAQGRETSSIHEPCVVHGRVEDKKAIMELLLNDQLSNTKFGTVPIVELSIKSCPKLLGKLPSNLPRLKTLKIMKCPQLVVEWLPSPTMPHGMRNTFLFDSLTSFSLYDISIPCSFNSPEVADEACSPSSSLTSMRLENIKELTCLPSWFLQGMMGLQELTIHRCQNLTILWQNDVRLQHWLPALRRLKIEKCPQLVSLFEEEKEGQQQQYEGLPNIMSLEHLEIKLCQKLEKLPRGLPSMLRTLFIYDCASLQSLPELMMLNNLEELKVTNCSALTCLCPGAESLPEGWFPTPNLRELGIKGCKKLDALPQSAYNKNNNLTSLQHLDIGSFPAAAGIASYVLKEGRSLTNLTTLTISNIDKPPSEWCLHRTRAAYLAFETVDPSLPQPHIHCRGRAASLAFEHMDLGLPQPRIISGARAASLAFAIDHQWLSDIETAV
ncbi:SNF2 domain-containing protein [Actinidia rufa]|uniref:SNF2 domain-containing protein n=1 Tax=Actinidia rufa TaxID=165716 RepID=A0A7J0FV57_9ERIC|nr:SNF2 domain-containing protein [Actinidia rufa]